MIRIIFIFILILALFAVLYLSFLRNWLKWGRGGIDLNYEREKLLNILRSHKYRLKSLSVTELELISGNIQLIEDNIPSSKSINGYCYNIHDEIIAAFAVRPYAPQAFLRVVCTKENTFTYISKNSHTKIYIDEVEVGTMDPSGNLYSPNYRLLASTDDLPFTSISSIHIYGRKVGNINKSHPSGSNARKVFTVLERLEKDEFELFLAISLLRITSTVSA